VSGELLLASGCGPVAAPAHYISQVISRSDTHQARSVRTVLPFQIPRVKFTKKHAFDQMLVQLSCYLEHRKLLLKKSLKVQMPEID
jgi:hypothetical protein